MGEGVEYNDDWLEFLVCVVHIVCVCIYRFVSGTDGLCVNVCVCVWGGGGGVFVWTGICLHVQVYTFVYITIYIFLDVWWSGNCKSVNG